MKQRRSVLSLAVVFAVIFVVLISSFFVAAETNHDCTGEDCPVCACIHQAEQNLKNLGTGLAVAAICLCSICCNFIVISLYCIAGGSEQTGCLPYINFSEGEAFGLKK